MRLAFGLALAMALTSPKHVTSGYFRNHLYVCLGLSVLTVMLAFGNPDDFSYVAPLAAALLSYIGSVTWLYEKQLAGRVFLGLVAAATLVAACQAAPGVADPSPVGAILWRLDPFSGGLVLGTTIAAMFLGHWYLNTPTMQLAPLRRLLMLSVAAIFLRIGVSGLGLALQWGAAAPSTSQLSFLALRWISGLLAPLLLLWMTWKTLEIPNTQSATGILYVAVIVTFTGELTAQLLSSRSLFPL